MSDKKIIPESDLTIGEHLQGKVETFTKQADKFCVGCGVDWSSDFALMLPVNGSELAQSPDLCHECRPPHGHVLLVGVLASTPKLPSGQADLKQLKRTGNSAVLTDAMYTKIFSQVPPNGSVCIVGEQVIKRLNRLKTDLNTVAKGTKGMGIVK